MPDAQRGTKSGGSVMRLRLVILLAIMVLPFVAFSVFKAQDINRSRTAERQQANTALARSVAYSIDDYVESTDELLSMIASSEAARTGDTQALSAWFSAMLSNCSHYANIVYFDTDGNLLASGRVAPHGKRINVSDAAWFQQSMESTKVAIGEFSYSKIGGIPDVHLSVPVFGEDGTRVGVVSAAMHLTRVQDRLMREKLPRHTTITVLDRKGTVIARNRDAENWVGRNVNKDFRVSEMVKNGEGNDEVTLSDGRHLVCTYVEAAGAPWFVRVGVDSDYIASLTASDVGAHYATFLPLLLVALAGWVWIGRDVDRLHNATEQLSLIDPLTRLWNSRRLNDDLDQAIQHALRSGESLGFAMMDLDDFKSYNDRNGHLAGDKALKAAAAAVEGAIRAADRAYRYGGEEFCVLLPDADATGASLVAERVREAVAGIGLRPGPDDDPVSLSISIGVAVFPLDAESVDELMTCADLALYRAKAEGKNRVVVHCGSGDDHV